MSLVKLSGTRSLSALTTRAVTPYIGALAAARRLGPFRRQYWSYRCAKPLKSFNRHPYQNSCRYPYLFRSTVNGIRSSTHTPNRRPHGKQDGKTSDKNTDGESPGSPWRDPFSRDYRSLVESMDARIKEEIDGLQKLLRDDPYRVFGPGARFAYNPFMSFREWRESIWNPVWFDEPLTTSKGAGQSIKNQGGNTESPKDSPAAKAQIIKTKPSTQLEEEYIDPITLKRTVRVIETSNEPLQEPRLPPTTKPDEGVNSPIKKHDSKIPVTDLGKEEIQALSHTLQDQKPTLSGFATQPWLIQEGFKPETPLTSLKDSMAHYKPQSPLPKVTLAQLSATTSSINERKQTEKATLDRVQSSLDRLNMKRKNETMNKPEMNKHNVVPTSASNPHPSTLPSKHKLEYPVQEKQDENIHLLRASDIRASAGLAKKSSDELSTEESMKIRMKLEKDFQAVLQKLHKQVEKEFIKALNSENPQIAPLAKTWAAYVEVTTSDAFNSSRAPKGAASFIKMTQDIIQRMKLDTGALQRAYGRPRMERGGGTSLGRYLNANRVSKALDEIIVSFEGWNKELQNRLGQDTEDSRELAKIFRRLRFYLYTYKRELGRQVLAPPHTKNEDIDKKKIACDAMLAEEVNQQKAVMQIYENQPRNLKEHPAPASTIWEDNLQRVREHEEQHELRKKKNQRQRDKKLYYEVRDIYEQEYGTITTGHRQKAKEVLPVTNDEASKTETDSSSQESPVIQEWAVAPMEQTSVKQLLLKNTEPKDGLEPIAKAPISAPEPQSSRVAEVESLMSDVRILVEALKSQAQTMKEIAASSVQSQETRPIVTEQFKSESINSRESIVNSSPVHNYRVLAYDEYSGSVVAASAKSALTSDTQSRTPAEIFMELERPQAFIEQMNDLEQSGWELLDGGKKMLLFRKTSSVTETQSAETRESFTSSQQMDASCAQSPNESSQISTKTEQTPIEETTGPYSAYTGPTIHREEPVFSGSGRYGTQRWLASAQRRKRWEKRRKRFWRFFSGVCKIMLYSVLTVYLAGLAWVGKKVFDGYSLHREHEQDLEAWHEWNRERMAWEKSQRGSERENKWW